MSWSEDLAGARASRLHRTLTSRHAIEVANLKRSVLESPGATDLSLRMAAFTGTEVPEDWAKYVRKVRDESYKVTAKDIGELSAKGYSEDMIFEVTVAAALGAAATRLEAGLRNLSERS